MIHSFTGAVVAELVVVMAIFVGAVLIDQSPAILAAIAGFIP